MNSTDSCDRTMHWQMHRPTYHRCEPSPIRTDLPADLTRFIFKNDFFIVFILGE